MGKSMYDLRDMLCEELENMTEQRNLSADRLKVIDMLTHSIKSIDTIIAMEDSGYSRNDGYSYADRYGRTRRDSRGRYSRDDGKDHLMHQLKDMMHESDDRERELIKRFMEQMGM